jgi:hypothetical protein
LLTLLPGAAVNIPQRGVNIERINASTGLLKARLIDPQAGLFMCVFSPESCLNGRCPDDALLTLLTGAAVNTSTVRGALTHRKNRPSLLSWSIKARSGTWGGSFRVNGADVNRPPLGQC